MGILTNHIIWIAKEEQWEVGERAVDWQPKVWTAVYVEGLEADITDFCQQLSASILDRWFANLSDSTSEYVIFCQKIFAYLKGDAHTRHIAQGYGASIGVPDHQLDW